MFLYQRVWDREATFYYPPEDVHVHLAKVPTTPVVNLPMMRFEYDQEFTVQEFQLRHGKIDF